MEKVHLEYNLTVNLLKILSFRKNFHCSKVSTSREHISNYKLFVLTSARETESCQVKYNELLESYESLSADFVKLNEQIDAAQDAVDSGPEA